MAEQTQEQETQQPAIQSTMSAAPKQLTSTDILSKMQTGTPLVQGEKLPDVPKGMSAKSFYGQFPGGAAVYSQAPFKQPTYGQVTTPITTTPTAPVSPPADTTPVDTAPVVEEAEENLSGGPTAEDIALDEAVAESISTNTQMDDLFDLDIDSGYTFDYDSDLTLTENIANEFEDFQLALTADISSVTDGTVVLNDIDKTLTNIGNSLSTAYDNALEEGEDALLSFIDDTKSILNDLETYAANPETIATDAYDYISKELNEFYDNLSLMTQPDHPDFDLALEQLAVGATKALMGSVIGAVTGVPVIGTLIVDLITNSDFFSDAMLGHPGQYETVTYDAATGTYNVEYTPTNIAYFDINGVARDINGKQVLTGRGGVATAGSTFVIPGLAIYGKTTRFEKLPDVVRDVEGGGFFDVYDQYNPGTDFTPGTTAADQEAALAEGDDTRTTYTTDVDRGFGRDTDTKPDDTKIDPATIQDFSGTPTADPGVGYVDTFGDAPSLPEAPPDTPTIAVSTEVEEDESTAPPAPPATVDIDVTRTPPISTDIITNLEPPSTPSFIASERDVANVTKDLYTQIMADETKDLDKETVNAMSVDQARGIVESLLAEIGPLNTSDIAYNNKNDFSLRDSNKSLVDIAKEVLAESEKISLEKLNEKYELPKTEYEKQRDREIKGSAGTDTVSNPYEAAETLFGEGETASTEQGEQDVAAQVDTFSGFDFGGDAGQGDDAAGGDEMGGADKIICTMMNRMYGMGDYRIKQWLLYSDRHLTAEHQLGYHKLYCKLVSMMPSNKIVAKILSHMAEKRTDDIVAEMKHTKRSWLGRTYRTLLIDKPSYMVGWMIKRNWLQPADISILTRKTCNG